MLKQKVNGLNPEVAKALGGMGVKTKSDEQNLRENRSKIQPKVAAILERMGIRVRDEDLVTEAGTSPLDMPGEAPLVDPNKGQPSGMQPQNKAGDPTQQKKAGNPASRPDVTLKKPATEMKTLQDVSDKMTEVTAAIKVVDLMVQALTDNKTSDNSIKTHKLTLRGPIQAVINAANDLKKMVE